MPILLSRDEFDIAMKKLHERLGSIEQALLELSRPAQKEVKKVIPLKKK